MDITCSVRTERRTKRPEAMGRLVCVLLYVKEEFNATERGDIKDEKFQESLWCDIKHKKEKILIGVCYRAPDATEDTSQGLCKLVEKVAGERALIMGDFNYHIDWENLEAERPQDKMFMECINDNFLTQHVTEATRGCNILDLVITSDDRLVENVNVGENFGTSDHQIVTFDLKVLESEINTQNQNKKNYFRGNYDQARQIIKTGI